MNTSRPRAFIYYQIITRTRHKTKKKSILFPPSKLYFDVPILRFITVTIGIFFSHDKLIIIYNKIKTEGFFAYLTAYNDR